MESVGYEEFFYYLKTRNKRICIIFFVIEFKLKLMRIIGRMKFFNEVLKICKVKRRDFIY